MTVGTLRLGAQEKPRVLKEKLKTATGLLFAVSSWIVGFDEPANAWSRGAHMVAAVIAFDELEKRDPGTVDKIIEILAHHPERAPFEVEAGQTTAGERSRRIFMELGRWADDVRGGAYDHPSWHGAFRPIIDPQDAPPKLPPDSIVYEGYEALALNEHIAKDERAPLSDRAVALCWIFHIVADIHQPLHAAELYSRQFPAGDQYGSLEYLVDPRSGQVVNLHHYWDFLPQADDAADTVSARAAELERKYPKPYFSKDLSKDPAAADDIAIWGDESYTLAKSLAYRQDRPRATVAGDAKLLSGSYGADSAIAAEQRLTLSGYRLGNILLAIFRPTGANANR